MAGLCQGLSNCWEDSKNQAGIAYETMAGEGEEQWFSIIDTLLYGITVLQHPLSWPVTGVPTQFSKATRENCFGAPTHLHPLVQPSCLTEDLLFVQLFSYPPFPVHLPSSGPLSFLVWIIIVVLSLVIRVLSPR